jgi:hypothetical protein
MTSWISPPDIPSELRILNDQFNIAPRSPIGVTYIEWPVEYRPPDLPSELRIQKDQFNIVPRSPIGVMYTFNCNPNFTAITVFCIKNKVSRFILNDSFWWGLESVIYRWRRSLTALCTLQHGPDACPLVPRYFCTIAVPRTIRERGTYVGLCLQAEGN